MSVDLPPPSEMRHAPFVSEVDMDIFLACIHDVENPMDLTYPGKHGELGPFQFMRATWEQHTSIPFLPYFVCDYTLSITVAINHFRWLRRELIKHDIGVNAYDMALAWNAGLTACLEKRAPASSVDYASRVQNLVQTYSRP